MGRTKDDVCQHPLSHLWHSVQPLAVCAAPPYRSDFFVGTAIKLQIMGLNRDNADRGEK